MSTFIDTETPVIENFLEVFKAFSKRGIGSMENLRKTLPIVSIDEFGHHIGHDVILDLDKIPSVRTYKLKPSGKVCDVVACDTSVIRLADGPFGYLAALRGSVIRRKRSGGIESWIIGPIIFFVSFDDNLPLFTFMSELADGQPLSENFETIYRSISTLLEKWLQRSLASTFSDSILLFDGSLTAGPADNSLQLTRETLNEAKRNGNVVLAFSKSTRLSYLGTRITSLVPDLDPPCVIDVSDAVCSSNKVHKLGRILVSHLSRIFFPYRLDVSEREIDDVLYAIGNLLSSDALIYGYPETLLLAHNYCTFNKLDVLALQKLLKQQFNIDVFGMCDVRSSLFNPLDGH
ncbi:MAG: DNA double-strand break repair nuclease NurA [Nitrososphaerota archaeon]|nr:DNA double-strand break repair nuclease NurA [Aigarchaeota archaeon]MDW8076519.1 DNA double-strand break repair nuclease NurA [Nitrososphaerota archaeon]